ncbi:hypothetical protein [Marinobacter caseinilyticus]|uniref:hypothetical protein n=1 Tax=Marinobacter caseinilyticus TaxID=2692195 RepID=UPI00140C11B6|nr:hypothetical protein [Marinobacter caseinilyticus]
MDIEPYDVTKAYLDMAYAIIDSEISVADDLNAKSSQHKNDADLARQSCAYLYSYMAITAFVSVHLFEQWEKEDSPFREWNSDFSSFERLMRIRYRELKDGLKALCDIVQVPRMHEQSPKVWQHLIEFVKDYRDFFVHPTPKKFSEVISSAKARPMRFPVDTAVEAIGYFYDKNDQQRPAWLEDRRDLQIPEIVVASSV